MRDKNRVHRITTSLTLLDCFFLEDFHNVMTSWLNAEDKRFWLLANRFSGKPKARDKYTIVKECVHACKERCSLGHYRGCLRCQKPQVAEW